MAENDDPEVCGLCGRIEPEHEGLNHGFSPDGQLIPPKPRQSEPQVLSSIDLPLRLLLIEVGLITVDDLVVKEVQLRDRLTSAPGSNASDPPEREDSRGDSEDRISPFA